MCRFLPFTDRRSFEIRAYDFFVHGSAFFPIVAAIFARGDPKSSDYHTGWFDDQRTTIKTDILIGIFHRFLWLL